MNPLLGITLLLAVVSNSYISASPRPPPEYYQETTRPPLLPRPSTPVPTQTKPYPYSTSTSARPTSARPTLSPRPTVPVQTKPYPVPGRPSRPIDSQFTILPFPNPSRPRPPRPHPSGFNPNLSGSPNPLRPKPIAATLPLELNSPPQWFVTQPNSQPQPLPHPHHPSQKPVRPASTTSGTTQLPDNIHIHPAHLNEVNARFFFGNKTVGTGNSSSLGLTNLFGTLFGGR